MCLSIDQWHPKDFVKICKLSQPCTSCGGKLVLYREVVLNNRDEVQDYVGTGFTICNKCKEYKHGEK